MLMRKLKLVNGNLTMKSISFDVLQNVITLFEDLSPAATIVPVAITDELLKQKQQIFSRESTFHLHVMATGILETLLNIC